MHLWHTVHSSGGGMRGVLKFRLRAVSVGFDVYGEGLGEHVSWSGGSGTLHASWVLVFLVDGFVILRRVLSSFPRAVEVGRSLASERLMSQGISLVNTQTLHDFPKNHWWSRIPEVGECQGSAGGAVPPNRRNRQWQRRSHGSQ